LCTASPGATLGLAKRIFGKVLLQTLILKTLSEFFCIFLIIFGRSFLFRHAGLDPASRRSSKDWIPGFAGMTTLIEGTIYK
jgi:hypothetical protein